MLREPVVLNTLIGGLPGELFVGEDGLPTLLVNLPSRIVGNFTIPPASSYYQPETFPAAWSLHSVEGRACGPLLQAWIDIADIRSMIADAQREAETEDRDRAQQREIDNRIAQEIEEGR